jgi:hypothetical protein
MQSGKTTLLVIEIQVGPLTDTYKTEETPKVIISLNSKAEKEEIPVIIVSYYSLLKETISKKGVDTMKKISLSLLIAVLVSHAGRAYASNKMVLTSIPSDTWYERVYLIANKIDTWQYENFTVQIGDMGEYVYNPSGWYHGKYDPDLQKQDMNRDGRGDIIIVLNNDVAGPGNPLKDVHIINTVFYPYKGSYVLKYEEAQIEPIKAVITRLTKIEKHGDIVTLLVGEKRYNIDLVPYDFKNPRDPYIVPDLVEYTIEDGTLVANISANVVRDNSVLGGFLGNIKIEYEWDGKRYTANKITFKQAKPENQK